MIQNFLTRVRRALRAFESERTDGRSSWQLTVTLERDDLDGGWVAECVDLPGCVSQGETIDEALANIADAIVGVVAARMQQQVSQVTREMGQQVSDVSTAANGAERRRVALTV